MYSFCLTLKVQHKLLKKYELLSEAYPCVDLMRTVDSLVNLQACLVGRVNKPMKLSGSHIQRAHFRYQGLMSFLCH